MKHIKELYGENVSHRDVLRADMLDRDEHHPETPKIVDRADRRYLERMGLKLPKNKLVLALEIALLAGICYVTTDILIDRYKKLRSRQPYIEPEELQTQIEKIAQEEGNLYEIF